MCIVGAVLVFGGFQDVPLWVVWLFGPILWYLGFTLTCAGLVQGIFAAVRRERRTARTQTVVSPQIEPSQAPTGLLQEVYPMDGFRL